MNNMGYLKYTLVLTIINGFVVMYAGTAFIHTHQVELRQAFWEEWSTGCVVQAIRICWCMIPIKYCIYSLCTKYLLKEYTKSMFICYPVEEIRSIPRG